MASQGKTAAVAIEKFVDFTLRHRLGVVLVVAIATLFLGFMAVRDTRTATVFSDLLPHGHPYVQVNERYKESFGGSNMVTIMFEPTEGDIFQIPLLEKIAALQLDFRQLDAINHFQIISIAARKLKKVRAGLFGVEAVPMMRSVPRNAREMEALRQGILQSKQVYGTYVARDLRSTLMTVDFIDRHLDYATAFRQINEILDPYRDDSVRIRVIGEPILYGWVQHYLQETVVIFGLTCVGLLALLFLIMRSWRGTFLPLLSGAVSGFWAMGVAALLGFNFDPLVIVLAFLITARAISHSVQLVTRFDDNLAAGYTDNKKAARDSMANLFRPGMLGVIADAGAMLVVALTPIPLLQKVAIIGAVWVGSIAISAVVLTPVLLSWTKSAKAVAHPFDVQPALHRFLGLCVRVVTGTWRKYILAGAVTVFGIAGILSLQLTVGDANPGSPILWQSATYNQDAAMINATYRGSDRMFLVVRGPRDSLKSPKILSNMRRLQGYMEAQPEVGGSVSLADIVSVINRNLHEGNPRYAELAPKWTDNGEYLFHYLSGSEPGDQEQYANIEYSEGSVIFFFRDHKGDTIRTGIERVRDYIKTHPLELEEELQSIAMAAQAGGASGGGAILGNTGTGGSGAPALEYRLAGGLIGVLGAVNEVILRGQMEAIALALLWLFLCCAIVYRNMSSGLFFMVPVVLSNVVTFSYMSMKGIGMSVNTLPVVALGIGLGVDYAFYVADGIREEMRATKDPMTAITKALHSAGRGVLVTAGTLSASIVLWAFSSLRFQAEMGILMCVWLSVSALSALFLVPSMAYIFRPAFIFGAPDHR